MQKMQSSFKITLLLYIIILILPFSFYFVYSSFKTIQKDTKAVQLVSWTAGAVENLAISTSDKDNKQLIIKVDKTLRDTSTWVTINDNSKYYIGATKLSEDFSTVQTCWNSYKQKLSQENKDAIRQHSLQCYDLTNNLAIIIEKMVYLKQNKMINMFYLSLTLAMILLLLVIYFVRVYIHSQMKKHAIHDHETHLFNQKYFLAELHSTFDRSVRHENPLSLISVTLNGFTNKTYDKKTKIKLMQELGELFTSVTRNSDIACRYNEDHIAVLLPLTDKEHALILEDRLKEALENHDFKVIPEMNFSFATTEANADETEEAFITRTLK